MSGMRALASDLRGVAGRWLHPTAQCDFGSFSLEIDRRDLGGRMYESLDYWGELRSPLEAEIVARFRPTLFVDVGANYGFTSLCHHAINPGCRVVAIEPAPHLVPFLRRNLDRNGLTNAEVLAEVCSDRVGQGQISLNPTSSQDNRVTGEGWKAVSVATTTLDSVLDQRAGSDDFVYIKIDTQGFERQVFRGGGAFLGRQTNWIARTEFAPFWLRSQGTEPEELLHELLSLYSVSELPKRPRFRRDRLDDLIGDALAPGDVDAFVSDIQGRAKDHGWCDLLVLPRDR